MNISDIYLEGNLLNLSQIHINMLLTNRCQRFVNPRIWMAVSNFGNHCWKERNRRVFDAVSRLPNVLLVSLVGSPRVILAWPRCLACWCLEEIAVVSRAICYHVILDVFCSCMYVAQSGLRAGVRLALQSAGHDLWRVLLVLVSVPLLLMKYTKVFTIKKSKRCTGRTEESMVSQVPSYIRLKTA